AAQAARSAARSAANADKRLCTYPLVCTADMVGCVFRRSAPLASLGPSGLRFFALAWWSQSSDACRAARTLSFVIASGSEAIQFRATALDCFVAGAPRNDEHDRRRESYFASSLRAAAKQSSSEA